MLNKMLISQFTVGAVLGAVIACSPTKFNPTTQTADICDASVTNCIVEQGFVDLTQNFEIGAGKVDILFIADNSASMSPIHNRITQAFQGFVNTLDARKVDYRIAVTTTDLEKVKSQNLISMANGRNFLSNTDGNRGNIFDSAIRREETIACEDFITGMFNSFGTSFQSQSAYAQQYYSKCPSPDTRGTYTGLISVTNSANSFIRSDANLNIILISNDEVRQGKGNLEDSDKYTTFISKMSEVHPTKYWDFSSIVVKDTGCQAQQTLRNQQGTVVSNDYGPAISGAIGYEYIALSNSAAKDIDGNPRPRGKVIDICKSDYASDFTGMATYIADNNRMINLKCVPYNTPVVKYQGGADVPQNLYTINQDKIVFSKNTLNQLSTKLISVSYKCYTGPK